MWIRFIANTLYNKEGDVVDVNEAEAKDKIANKQAVEHDWSQAQMKSEKPVVEEGVIIDNAPPAVVINVVRGRKRRVK